MGDNNRILNIVLQLQDQASEKLKTLAGNLSSEDFKKGADQVSTATLAMGAAFIAASAYSVKMASDFQSSMTLIQTQAGASSKEVENMTASVLALAPAVGQSPKALADALFYIESAGYRGAQALDILKLAAEGAAVGHSDLTKTADALTTVMNSGVKGVNNATQAMGVMNAIVGNGKMKMDDLIGALSTGILPAAREAGISIQDMGASLDVMTNNGVPAEEAATRLRMTLSLMSAPTAAAQSQLESIGLTQRSLADDMRKGGIIDAITDLNNHMNAVMPASTSVVKGTKMSADQLTSLSDKILTTNDRLQKLQSEHGKTSLASKTLADNIKTTQDSLSGYSDKLGGANEVIKNLGGSTLDAVGKAQLLAAAFGGGKSSSSIEMLTQQADKLKSSLTGINQTSDNFAASWQKTQDDNGFATQKLVATVQTLAVQYGNMLLPYVTKVESFLANNLVPAIQNVTKFFETHKAMLAAVAGILTGVLVVGLIAVAISLAALLAPAAGFIAAVLPIAAAVGVVAALIVSYWKQITAATMKFVNDHKQLFTDMWTVLKSIFEFSLGFIQAAWKTVWGGIATVGKGIWEMISGDFQIFLGVLEIFFGVFSAIFTGNWTTAWTQVKKGFTDIWDGIKTYFQGVLDLIVGMAKTAINSVIGIINGLIGGINKVGSSIAGVKTNMPLIPHLATGTNFFQGGTALVGENGPELVNLPRGSQVIPNNQINSNNSSSSAVNISAVYVNGPGDINLLAQRLDFLMRTSGRY